MEFQLSYFKSWKMTALNMPANLENSAVATGLEKVSFHSNPKERQCQRMLKLPHNCTHLTCTPLQYSCLENPMDRGAWWAAVHGVTRSRTRLSDWTELNLRITSTIHRVQLLFPAAGSETFTCTGSPMTSVDEDFNRVNLLTHCETAENSDSFRKPLLRSLMTWWGRILYLNHCFQAVSRLTFSLECSRVLPTLYVKNKLPELFSVPRASLVA